MVVPDRLHTVAVVGVGLIGGSVGLAARARGLAGRVVGVGHRQTSLDRALERGAIDVATLDVREGVAEADLVVLATPVGLMAPLVREAADALRPDTVLTDVGSTKGRLACELGPLTAGRCHYVGSHPMAGSEKRGVDEASATLFEGALCFVTPTADSDPAVVAVLDCFWSALGARVRHATPDQHDALVAGASHLPHAVAAALVNATPPAALACISTGFRDTTRVAAGDPRLWADVCLHNRDCLLEALAAFDGQIQTLRHLLQRGDEAELVAWLRAAKSVRDESIPS
ncbi:MAG: prephenate dehydrogenase [Candidatus Brocadiae bacterium]|nr:prephenate dehydrogenase [Candidatus Brocadiia bacterium]